MNTIETLTLIGDYLRDTRIIREKSYSNLSLHFLQGNEMSEAIRESVEVAENGSIVIKGIGSPVPEQMLNYRFSQNAGWSDNLPELKLNSKTYDNAYLYENRVLIGSYFDELRCPAKAVNGYLSVINRQADSLYVFGSEELFRIRYRAILSQMILDAIARTKDKKGKRFNPREFLKAIPLAVFESSPAVGNGTEYRFQSDLVAGSALAYDNTVIYLQAFNRNRFEGL